MKQITSLVWPAILGVCLAALLLLLPGCASPVQSKAMTPVGFKTARQHPVSVIVQKDIHYEGEFTVTGFDTPVVYEPELTGPAFYAALMAALKESQTFASVREQPPADCNLSVNLVKTKWEGGFRIKQTVSSRWKLTRLSDNRVVFDEFITTTGTAHTGEALGRPTVLRIALERAGQENIKQGLTKLSELDLH